MIVDVARAEKAHHMATYETTTCRTVYMCTRVRLRMHVRTCVRMCVCVWLRRKHTVNDFR